MSRPLLHVMGCGRAGRTLARLWVEAGVLEVGQVVNRGLGSARAATAFIGQGRAVEHFGDIGPADWLMLGVPDSRLYEAVDQLTGQLNKRPALVFHLSGSEPSTLLAPLETLYASVHPVCPFSDPEYAVKHFAGCHAVGEGQRRALEMLLPCFERIGARPVEFLPTDKRRYHAATIAASNFLNVLDDLALALAESAGLERGQALELLVSLQRASLSNIERAGPMNALTGPIERADEAVCRQLRQALDGLAPAQLKLFNALAQGAVELAARKHPASSRSLSGIGRMFDDSLPYPRCEER
ncbi:MAG: DUF2520 domain-containing protein [Wenzhouxiangellaceae bacterium]|nr:DUF2520 domain-containing protein [Wenzhouxiangellaceae bacterium]